MSKDKTTDPLDRKFSLDTMRGQGIRGKYFKQASKGGNVVKLDPEIARMFPTEDAVNAALASVIALAKIPSFPVAPKARRRKQAAA